MSSIRNPARSRPLSANVKRLMKMARESPLNPNVEKIEREFTDRDLAYCVSPLPLTERGLRKMLDNFDCFGDKLSDESIFSAFLSIVGKLRRGAKPEGKVRRACSFQAAAPTGVLRLQVSDLVPS